MTEQEKLARIARLDSLIAQGEAAYERLMFGKAPRVIVDAGGDRVEFTAVSAAALAKQITDWKLERDALQCVQTVIYRQTQPIGFLF